MSKPKVPRPAPAKQKTKAPMVGGPPVHADTPKGNVDKASTNYLRLIKANTMHPSHPRHQGIAMQAHHLISQAGVELGDYSDRLEDLGYNINALDNLVFIPHSLQGACLLHIQPHRGNHTATNESDEDSRRDPDYHVTVRERLEAIISSLNEICGAPGIEVTTQVSLNRISSNFAKMIQYKPGEARLSALWKHFTPGHPRGCGGVDNIGHPNASETCPVGRKHTGAQGPGQARLNITYNASTPYVLTPGQ